jgi:hypothetical protein
MIGCRTEHRRRALLDEPIRAFRPRIERRARNREHFATLFERKPRGDQRARALGRFDDDDPKRHAGDQPVAAREILRAGFPAERHFGRLRSGRQNIIERTEMIGRINAVLASGKDGDRSGSDAGPMRGCVDAARQTRRDGKSGVPKIARELLRNFHPGRRRIARADDGDTRLCEDLRATANG